MATEPIEREEESRTEDRPLLEASAHPSHSTKPAHSSHLQLYTVSLVLALVIIIDFGAFLANAPRLRLIENILCLDFYREHDPTKIGPDGVIPEESCKKDIVQGRLALLFGWMGFFEAIPGLFLAIPYGYLADKHGRKWLMVLNSVSFTLRYLWVYVVCAFPDTLSIQLIWLESVFCILGGGTEVILALLLTILSDVTPEDQRANTFFLMRAGASLSAAIAPPLASIMMDRSPWAPMTLSVGLLAIAIPVSVALPETLGARQSQDYRSLSPDSEPNSPYQHGSPNLASSSDSGAKDGMLKQAIAATGRALGSASILFRDWRLILIMLTFVVNAVETITSNLLLQYASKRLQWTLSKANYLFSFRALVIIILLLALLPVLSYWLTRHQNFTTRQKDVLFVRLSYSIFAIGQSLIGCAGGTILLIVGVFISAVGEGGFACARSVLTTLVEPNEVARVFTAVSIVGTVGTLIANPMVAGLYNAGMKLGEGWIGLPYLVCGALFAAAAAAMWTVDFSAKGEGGDGSAVGIFVDVE